MAYNEQALKYYSAPYLYRCVVTKFAAIVTLRRVGHLRNNILQAK